MPIYEYEPIDWDCLICQNRLEVLQGAGEAAHSVCPTCGMDVRRVVSRASMKISKGVTSDKAAERGFTTFRKTEKGKWERIAGEGPDFIVGTEADMKAVEAEKNPPKKPIDLG